MSNTVLYSKSSPNSGVTSRLGARLRSQIDSVFIPMSSPQDDSDEKVMLLTEGSDPPSSIASSASDPHLFRRLLLRPLHPGDDLLPPDCPGSLLDTAVLGDNDEEVFFIATDSNHIFRFLHLGRIITSIDLKVDSEKFYPEHLSLESGGRCALVTGWTREKPPQNFLLRVDLNSGAVLSRTRPFEIQKFGALAAGSEGTGLWLTSPEASPDRPNKSQVIELSPDFRRKVHFVNLNSERAAMRPLALTCDSRSVFVSVARRSTEGESADEEEGRLLSFPAAPGPGDDAQKTKEWLSVTSWNFQALSPGKLVTLSGIGDGSRRLLVLDRKYGSLHVIIWTDSDLVAKPLCLPVKLEVDSGETLSIQGIAMGRTHLFVFTEEALFVADSTPLLE